MTQAIQAPETLIQLPFPLRGLDLSSEYDLQPPLTTPVANNVRGHEPVTQRDRGGQRPGLWRYLGQIATASVIQHLNFIVDPQAEALSAETDEDEDFGIDYIDDPSSNNLKNRNFGISGGPRRVRRRGSARQPSMSFRTAKLATHINWGNPAEIIVGTALSDAQLNAVAYVDGGIIPVAGTLTYTPRAGAVLKKGNGRPLRVRFAPTNPGLYRSSSKTVFINVVLDRIVTHVDPDGPLQYSTGGGTLANQGLHAIGRAPSGGEVAGVMTYTPPGSTVPFGSSISIQYYFVPTDLVAYFPARLTESYPVIGGTPSVSGNGPIAAADGLGGATSGVIVINPGEPDEYTVDSVAATVDPGTDVLPGDGDSPISVPDNSMTATEDNIGLIAFWRYHYGGDAWYYYIAPS